MDAEKYIQIQLDTLRREIEECLTRSFQIMIGGATLIPILAGVADRYNATPIMIALPLVVVIAALMYLNQWSMIMRAGRYIRTELEPQIVNVIGWETWLEKTSSDDKSSRVDNRLVDRYIAYAFYVLALGYFFAASWVGFAYAHDHLGHGLDWAVLGVYVITAVAMLVVLLRRVPTTTTTKAERMELAVSTLTLKKAETTTTLTVEKDRASLVLRDEHTTLTANLTDDMGNVKADPNPGKENLTGPVRGGSTKSSVSSEPRERPGRSG